MIKSEEDEYITFARKIGIPTDDIESVEFLSTLRYIKQLGSLGINLKNKLIRQAAQQKDVDFLRKIVNILEHSKAIGLDSTCDQLETYKETLDPSNYRKLQKVINKAETGMKKQYTPARWNITDRKNVNLVTAINCNNDDSDKYNNMDRRELERVVKSLKNAVRMQTEKYNITQDFIEESVLRNLKNRYKCAKAHLPGIPFQAVNLSTLMDRQQKSSSWTSRQKSAQRGLTPRKPSPISHHRHKPPPRHKPSSHHKPSPRRPTWNVPAKKQSLTKTPTWAKKLPRKQIAPRDCKSRFSGIELWGIKRLENTRANILKIIANLKKSKSPSALRKLENAKQNLQCIDQAIIRY